jgi:hypothetical protein
MAFVTKTKTNPTPSQMRSTMFSQRLMPSCLNSKVRISKPTRRADCAAIPPQATTKAQAAAPLFESKVSKDEN